MSKKRIFIDVDHVLADLISKWVEKYNQLYEDSIQTTDVTMWDWHTITKAGTKIYSLLTPDLFEGLPVIEDSQRVVQKLQEKYEVFIITAARNASVIPSKAKWLKNNFPFIKKDNIVYAVNKHIILGDYLIDDKPENLEGFVGEKLLFNAPHNQNEIRFTRMNNWLEIEKYFDNES
mgnify:CR=1 FL=1